MDMDAPLDFEFEDPLVSLPTPKRRKVIGLDDLVTDHFKQQTKLLEKEAREANARKLRNLQNDDANGDDYDNQKNKEDLLNRFVDNCQKQVEEIQTENDAALWGLRVFGHQKPLPPLDIQQLGSCSLLQSVMNNEINAILGLTREEGQNFLEELLINGWLSELVFTCAHVEEPIAAWTFYLMLYSSNEDLRTSACNFWCIVLSQKDKVGLCSVKIKGFPSYSDLKKALEVYGYLLYTSKDFSSLSETNYACSASEGPPQNIRLWVKFVTVCCQARSTQSIFSNNSEAEELLGVLITLFVDRRLQGLSLLLHESVLSVISSFTEEGWCFSCERVATSLASRTQKNFNSLRLVECISGVDTRSKQLRREVAFRSLVHLFDKVYDGEEILSLLLSINFKDENCQFFPIYIDLVLTEYWLFSNPLLDEKPLILEMWCCYLRKCSSQICSTDMRPYASKVRNKASFLLQSIDHIKDGEWNTSLLET